VALQRSAFARGLLACVAFGVGFLSVRDAVVRYRRATASERWPRANGVITASDWAIGGQRRSAYARITVQYRVNAQLYEGHRVSFQNVTAQRPGAAADVAAAYPEGSHVVVYYNPADPGESVLMPGGDGNALATELVLGVAACVAGVAVFAIGRQDDA
jgi:hypothetical protein